MAESRDDYNYTTFTTSEARGKTRMFANSLHTGEEAPDFDLRRRAPPWRRSRWLAS